jgi:hypothetical protein
MADRKARQTTDKDNMQPETFFKGKPAEFMKANKASPPIGVNTTEVPTKDVGTK